MKRIPRRRRKPTSDPVQQLKRGIQLLEAGDLDEAETLCRRALSAHPAWPQALHILGLIAVRRNQLQQAVKILRKAIDADPGYLLAYNDLGNVLHELGDLTAAISTFSKLLELQPDDPRVLNNLGTVLKDNQQIEESIVVLLKATQIDPEYFGAHRNLSWAYQKAGNLAEAIRVMERAASLEPRDARPIRALARLYRLVEDPEKVVYTYERWIALEPDNPIPRHMLVANTATDVPDKAAEEYVRAEFDRFADSFDDKLQSLNYRAPSLVGDQVAGHSIQPQSLVILDGGCGTGLSGEMLRPFARRLVGVDLSSGMLKKARSRGVYDELIEMEIGEYLDGQPEAFDLITIVDTFIYFGELLSPLTRAAAALRPGGYICYTLEALGPEASDQYVLSGSGRFLHSRDYVEQCMVQAGFESCDIAEVVLREENARPVAGLLVWAHAGVG